MFQRVLVFICVFQIAAPPAFALNLTFTRDNFGNILSTDNGRTTYTDQRDANGLLTQAFDTYNPENRSYDNRARLIQRNFKSGRTLQYTYDDYDRVTAITDSHGPSIQYVYDVMGRLLSETVSDGTTQRITRYVWDVRDRLESITDAQGRVARLTYDKIKIVDKPASVIDPAGNETRFVYDSRQRLIEKIEPNQAVTRYTYNARGDLTSATDANGNVTVFAIDGNGRKIQELRPSVSGDRSIQQPTKIFYDAADRVTRIERHSPTGGDMQAVLYEYDELDRVVRKILQKGSAIQDDSHFTYEPQLDATLLKSAANAIVTLQFAHDPAPPYALTGFSVHATDPSNPLGLLEDDFTIERDVTGNIASITGANSGLIYTKAYDPAGRLIGAQAGNHKIAITHDGFGRKSKIAHSDGTTAVISYDFLDRFRKIVWKEGFKNSVEQYLNYDQAGNVKHLARENALIDLVYDQSEQLLSSKSTGMQGVPLYNRSFQLDLMGNRIGDSLLGSGTFVSNFLTQDSSASYLADADGMGRLEKASYRSGLQRNYLYRADGMLAAYTDGTTQAQYFYDPLGRRVAKTILKTDGASFIQSYVYLGEESRILLGKAGDGSITTYIDGEGVNEHLAEVKNGIGKPYIFDHLGSILNSEAGGSARAYGLFGEVTHPVALSASSNPAMYAFAGAEYDAESGLLFLRNRWLDTLTGKFTTPDPIGTASGDLNFYRYVLNSPLRYVDPFGTDELDVTLALEVARKIDPNLPKDISFDFEHKNEESNARTSLFGNHISLTQRYAGQLNDDQRYSLLRTILHESQHVTENKLEAILDALKHGTTDTPAHRAIGLKAQKLTEQNWQEYISKNRRMRAQYERIFCK